MEDIIKIVASVIGLIIYFFLNNKNKPKTKPAQGPTDVNPPLSPRKKPVVIEEEEIVDEGPRYEPVTFEELLEQFGDSKKKTATSRMEREEKYGIDDEFIPATDTKAEEKAELEQYYAEHDDSGFAITEEDLEDQRAFGFGLAEEKKNYYAKLLNNPQSIRDAFVLKEIFDRKHF